MKLCITHEDNEVVVSYTPEEFIKELDMWITLGKTPREAMDEMIKKLKQAVLTK